MRSNTSLEYIKRKVEMKIRIAKQEWLEIYEDSDGNMADISDLEEIAGEIRRLEDVLDYVNFQINKDDKPF